MTRYRNSPYTQDEIEEKINNGIRTENEYNFEKRRILEKELKDIRQSVQDAEDAYNNATSPKAKKKALQELLAVQEELISKEREYRNLNTFNTLVDDFEKFSKSAKNFYSSIRDFVNPWAKADEAASKFTKTLGGTKKAMDALRSRTIDNVATGIGVKFNTSMEELIEAQTNYLKGIGRNVSIDDSSQESIAAISRISKDAQIDGLGLASQFENFGVSLEKTGDHLGEMFADASKHGISFQKYSENVTKNIRIAQNYTFKDGLKGLENMAKKATAIKMDMQQVANFADKVSTVEGALETSAKLQVLGGPFASLADPMAMLNESLNDMEAFQDRQAKLFSQFGHFDKTTGEVTVSSFDKQRLKAYAEASGQDISSIMESVHTGAKRAEISKQIMASATASKFDKDMKELIMNTASFKDGKAGVSVNGKFKNIDELTDADKETMMQMTQSESKDIKQIAMDLRSLVQREEGIKKAFEGVKAWLGAPLGKLLTLGTKIFDTIGLGVGILGTIALAQGIGSIGGSITNMFGKGGSIRRLGKLFTGTSRGSAYRIGGGLKKGLNFIGGGLKKGFKGAGGFIKNIFNGVSNGAASPIGNSSKLGSTLLKGGKALLKGGGLAGAGAGLSIAGAIGNHYTDKAVAEGKMEVGGIGHKAAKAGSQALTGAGIGLAGAGALAALGATGVGLPLALLGAVIGGGVGLYQASKAKNKKVLDEQLAAKGIEVKGDYSNGKLKDIDKALQDGKLSDSLRRKLIANGDMAIVTEIEKKKEELDAKNEKKKEEKIRHKMNIGVANISIGVANIKGIGLGETFNPLSILKNNPASLDIKVIKEKGFVSHFDKSKDKVKENYSEEKQSVPKSFDININGTLKLEGNDGQAIDIINELRRNPNLLRTLSDMIAKEIGYIEKNTYVV
jgi:hypothetical protein